MQRCWPSCVRRRRAHFQARRGQAHHLRALDADSGPLKVPNELPDEKVLFFSDIILTGYRAAEQAGIDPGDTGAVGGCGPIAPFVIKSAWTFKAGRVIASDWVPKRLRMAQQQRRRRSTSKGDVYEKLMQMTKGRGPDGCMKVVRNPWSERAANHDPARGLRSQGLRTTGKPDLRISGRTPAVHRA